MIIRLTRYWVYGGFLAGILILLLLPVIARGWSTALLMVFVQLPIYMLHQYEEHDDDRFRLFVNRTVGGGHEALSHAAVFIINVPGVWGVIAVSFYLAADVRLGFGLIALYLTLVNGLTHIIASLVSRRYNPGLATSLVLFLPASIYGLYEAGNVAWYYHLLGVGMAVMIHATIMAHVMTSRRRLEKRIVV